MTAKRITYFDFLRVFATVAVILLHTSTQNWAELPGRSVDWNILNFYNSLTRWCVPAFIAISGPLFLKRDIPIRTLYSKYILRMVAALVAWTLVYGFCTPVCNLIKTGLWHFSLAAMLDDAYHLWFIPMIIGLYMCVPILKHVATSRQATKYFLILSFIFTFVFPQLQLLVSDFVGGSFANSFAVVTDVRSHLKMELVLGFPFYFLLGVWLHDTEFSKKQRCAVYILGAVGFLSTILLSAAAAWKTNAPCSTYYSNFTVNVLLETIAVHTFFKYKPYKREKRNHIFAKLADCCFGAYLIHIFVLAVIRSFGLNTLTFRPELAVPIIALLASALSFALSFVLRKIPFINKWLT